MIQRLRIALEHVGVRIGRVEGKRQIVRQQDAKGLSHPIVAMGDRISERGS